jgi:thioredoxin-related protein
MKRLGLVILLSLCAAGVRAAENVPAVTELPPWFVESFLDFPDEIRDAAKSGKRLMVYFGQEGCPYCKELLQNNFSQKAIVDKTRKHFVPIALNIWGDREVTWLDGRRMPEKDFAKLLRVQFTPTLLFLDEQGQVVTRLNGYYPPHRFETALDYVAGRMEKRQPFADYMKANVKEAASDKLHDEPFFMKPPYDLRRKPGGKPLAAVFEARSCVACDELHQEGFKRREVQALLPKFDVVRLSPSDRNQVTTPDGKKLSGEAWARALKVAYTPSIVFFDASGKEVFRVEAYLRPFHLATSLEYVADGGYRSEPEFQRYLRNKADKLRARGEKIELWQ